MIRAWAAAMLFAASLVFAFDDAPRIAAFSLAAPGSPLPAPWRAQHLPRAKPARLSLVADGAATVLRVQSSDAAGAAILATRIDAAKAPSLAWRWKVDRVVDSADLSTKAGDDFAARVYVFFDVPLETLPWSDRVKVHLARIINGEALPTAGICYVWDSRHPAGTSQWSPYTDRIRIVVLESGAARAGQWVAERRDVAADFRAAFGSQWHGPVPAITGIAAGNDTDQTHESVTAWFGDFVFGPAP